MLGRGRYRVPLMGGHMRKYAWLFLSIGLTFGLVGGWPDAARRSDRAGRWNDDDDDERHRWLVFARGPGGETIVLFANVDISADVMPTATNPGGAACSPDPSGVAYPSQEKVFTAVEVVCP